MRTTPWRAAALILLAAAPVAAQETQLQNPMFQKGAMYAGPRVWLGNLNGGVAVGGQVERTISEAEELGPGFVSVGVGVDFYSWSYDYGFGKYSYSVVPLQAFGNYHFRLNGSQKLDPYLGLGLIYSIVSASWSGDGVAQGAEASSLGFAGQAGLRYFLTEKFALQGQVGFGYGTLAVGTAWRF